MLAMGAGCAPRVGVTLTPPLQCVVDRRVECDKVPRWRTEMEIIQVQGVWEWDKIIPPSPTRKRKRIDTCRDQKKTRKPRGWLGRLLLCGQRGDDEAST